MNIYGIKNIKPFAYGSNLFLFRGEIDKHNYVLIKTCKSNKFSKNEINIIKHEYDINNNIHCKVTLNMKELIHCENRMYILMEDFDGITLRQMMNNRKISNHDFLKIAVMLISAIGEIHKNNVIYGDLRPENILISPNLNQIKIWNFENSNFKNQNSNNVYSNMPQVSLAYMSPEQTKRINREVDYQTDFYSLGIILYEMITGSLPFESKNITELVYCHIAKQPIPPKELNKNIDNKISDTIMKLLSKDPEDRFKSSDEIKNQLEECVIDECSIEDTINRKSLYNIAIQKNIYGRYNEMLRFKNAYKRVREINTEIALVTGERGIGKTLLIDKFLKSVEETNPVIICNCDSDKTEIPFYCLVQGIKSCINKLDNSKYNCNRKLIDELKKCTSLLMKSMNCKGQNESSQSMRISSIKFDFYFQALFKTFVQHDHPFVIFIDNFQWIDRASFKLLTNIINLFSKNKVFFIISSRNFEAKEKRKITIIENSAQKSGVYVNNININALNKDDIENMVVNRFGYDEGLNKLAEIIFEKTKGNPLIIEQFLATIDKNKMFYFDYEHNVWKWNTEKIKNATTISNMINIIKHKYNCLPENHKKIMKYSACIGNEFDIKLLQNITLQDEKAISEYINEAISYGLIKPCKNENIENRLYSFLNSDIHHTIYSLINDDEKEYIHYCIAKEMIKKLDLKKIDDFVFVVLNHYNRGKKYIKDYKEKIKLARLNYYAGITVENSNTYEMAETFYGKGIDVLPEDSYNKYFYISFYLNYEYAKCKCLNNKMDEANNLINKLTKKASTQYQHFMVYSLYIAYFSRINNYKKVIDIAIKALNTLGINVNLKIRNNSFKVKSDLIYEKFTNGQAIDIEAMPVIKSTKKKSIIKLLVSLIYHTDIKFNKLYESSVLNGVEYCINNGNSSLSPLIYINYARLLIVQYGDYKKAIEIGQKSINLTNNFKNSTAKSAVLSMYAIFILNYREHISVSCNYLKESIDKTVNSNKLSVNGFPINAFLLFMIMQGKNIDYVIAELRKYINEFNKNNKFSLMIPTIQMRKMLEHLKECSISSNDAIYKDYNPNEIMNDYNAVTFKICLSFTAYLCGNYDEAIDKYKINKNEMKMCRGTIFDYIYTFTRSIAITSVYDESSDDIQKSLLQILKLNLKKLERFSEVNPINFECRYMLIKAEYYKITGRVSEAMETYSQAIKSARKNKFINIEALTYELAGKFYLKNRFTASAKACILEAIHYYKIWGADGRAKRLNDSYIGIFSSNLDEDTVENSKLYNYSSLTSEGIDFNSALKASFAISSEIEKDKLLEKLMENVTLNAAAQKGYLIMISRNNELIIEAESNMDSSYVSMLKSEPLEKCDMISKSVVYYVLKTMDSVVFNNSNISMFTSDSYIIKYKPKSILCMPIMLNGRITAILYLENNAITHAFTKDRLQVLKLICTQAAISIQNARMFSETKVLNQKLEKKVEERTYELQQTVEKLKKQNNERKIIQRELAKSERRYRKVVNACPDTIIVNNGEQIEFINDAGVKLLGFKNARELIGKNVYDLFDKNELDESKNFYLNYKKIEGAHFYEHKVKKRTGETIYTEIATMPFENDSDCKVLTIMRDITSRRHEEELKNKVEEKNRELTTAKEYDKLRTEFFANVSHELRTPLNVILAAQQVLNIAIKNNVKPYDNNKKIEDYMKMIKQNCYRLVRLINNLIDITKMDAGYFQVNFGNYDIISIVENITLSVAGYVESKGIKLIFDTDIEEKVMAFDPDKIERIMLNLLANAVKFTEAGGKIKVNINDFGDKIKITVQDNGIGIPEEKQKLIFERFMQVDKSLSRNREGSGIGLSLVKSLIEMHNGTINLESKVGKGSKFIIELPVKTIKCDNNKSICDNYLCSNVERINIEFSDIYS